MKDGSHNPLPVTIHGRRLSGGERRRDTARLLRQPGRCFLRGPSFVASPHANYDETGISPHLTIETPPMRRSRNQLSSLAFALLAPFILLALPEAVGARDIYVDNEKGDDRYRGQYPLPGNVSDGPCRTIKRALFLAGAGDRIILAKNQEPYQESITLQGARHSGLTTNPFRLVGNGAVIDGRSTIRGSVWQPVRDDLYRFQPATMSTGMLFRDGQSIAPRRGRIADARPAQLQPGEGILFDAHYYFRAERGKIPHDYELSAPGQPVGLTLCDIHDVVIEDLVIQGFQLDGISAADGVANVRLEKVVSQANGRSGFAIKGASRLQLVGCQASANGRAQVWVDDYATVQLSQSVFSNESAPEVHREGGRVTP